VRSSTRIPLAALARSVLRQAAFTTALVASFSCSRFAFAEGIGQDGQKPEEATRWQSILARASEYVDREWANGPLPFKTANREQLHAAPRKVFAHYFTPFPLSFDNLPADEDYYAQHYLKRTGENNKFHDVGGYLRERPLSAGPWQSADWQKINLAIEILRAQRIGIDGFGVDLLALEGSHWQQTLRLFEVAAAIGHDFTIVPEPDMFALKSISETELVQGLTVLLANPAAYHLRDGRALVIPFYAEAKPPEFWKAVSDSLAKNGHPIALILDFVDPATHTAYDFVSYGYTIWGARDVLTLQMQDTRENLRAFLRASGGAPIMAPVAPQDTRPKEAAFWEAHNTNLYRTLWTKAIDSPAQFAHLITWNDYSEASETSPSSRTQYVFHDLAAYYISWFKTGVVPPVETDAIFYSYRGQILHPETKIEPKDKAFQLRGRTGLSNDIEMLAFLKSPAMLEIEIDGTLKRKQGAAGLNSFMVTARAGRPVFRITRGEALVLETRGTWTIEAKPERADPLYAGGSSMRNQAISP